MYVITAEDFTAAQAYMPRIRALAGRYCGRGAEFDDLVQEGFLALASLCARHRHEGRSEDLALYLWFRLPARVRDAAARLRRPDRGDSLEALAEADVPFEPADPRDDYRLCELRASLPPEGQELLRSLSPYATVSEAAQALGVPATTLFSRIERLKKKLRQAEKPRRSPS